MNLADFHLLDIFFFALGSYFVVKGFLKGFAAEIVSLAGFLFTIYASFKLSGIAGGLFCRFIGVPPSVGQIIAVLFLWFFIAIIIGMITRYANSIIMVSSTGNVNKILGAAAGMLKLAGAVYSVMIIGMLLIPVINPTWMTKSSVLRYAGRYWPDARSALVTMELLPKGFKLPYGTLEQILRPYRTGSMGPKQEEEGSFNLLNFFGNKEENSVPNEEDSVPNKINISKKSKRRSYSIDVIIEQIRSGQYTSRDIEILKSAGYTQEDILEILRLVNKDGNKKK